MSNNGLVSFDRRFSRYQPSSFPGFTYTSLLAPFWGDVDTRLHGSVFYNSYSGNMSPVMARATSDVRMHAGSEFTDFSASWMLVATWVEVPNSPDGNPDFSDDLSALVCIAAVAECWLVTSCTLFSCSATPSRLSL